MHSEPGRTSALKRPHWRGCLTACHWAPKKTGARNAERDDYIGSGSAAPNECGGMRSQSGAS
jgi:hypothetical protein